MLAPIGLFAAPTPLVIGAFATLAILNVIIFEQIASKIQSVPGGDIKIENPSPSNPMRVSFSDYGHLIEIVKQNHNEYRVQGS